MIFGGGDIYQQLAENPMTNPIYEELLNGTFEFWADLTVEQKLFVWHMKSKVPRDTEAEAAELLDPMVLKEWHKFFLKAKEGTTDIVISGIHRGIYKACAKDDMLAMMQMPVISLAFEFDLKGVLWWQQVVHYILDKGKGSCLGSLSTIKLLECDLHFGLKWAFTWQMGSFAEKHQLYNYKDYQHALPGKWHHVPTINKPEEFNNGFKI